MSEAVPISEARAIAVMHDYDQVIILARKVGGSEWVTTYGVSEQDKHVAAVIGQTLREQVTPRITAMTEALEACLGYVPMDLKGRILQAIKHPPLEREG